MMVPGPFGNPAIDLLVAGAATAKPSAQGLMFVHVLGMGLGPHSYVCMEICGPDTGP